MNTRTSIAGARGAVSGLLLLAGLLPGTPSAQPAVTATQRDSLFLDTNANLRADSGDVLLYTVVITNSGSVTANDVDPDGIGPALTVSGFQNPSANGGNVSVSANGAFTYNPSPGFTGTDTFTYTISDGEGNQDTATVTLTVSGLIWFVNAGAAPGGDGRLTAPFNALTGAGSFAAVAADDPGDNIFLYSGTYSGGLTLLNNQKLIGQGATASLSAIAGLTPPPGSLPLPATGGARPTLAAAANNVILGSGNLVRGLNLTSTGNVALLGASVGTLTLADLSLTNTAGVGVNLANGTLTGTLTAVNASGSANGIKLVSTTGSFAVTGTGAAGSGGTLQNTTGGDGSVDGNGVYLDNAGNVSLTAMTIGNHPNFAIRGINVNGFAMTNTTVNGVNGNNAGFDEASISFSGLTGSATLSGCNISGGWEDNVRVVNSSDTLNRLNLLNTTIGANSTANGNDGVLVEASGSATVNVTVNAFRDAVGTTLNVFKGNGGGIFTGSILNNQIGVSGLPNSGSAQASGIQVLGSGAGTHTT